MAFDTFDEGIAPGGLRSKNEIKILICYLFNTVDDKMSQSLVVEAIRADELANFFEIVVAFEELIADGNLEKNDVVDGEQTYIITENGKIGKMFYNKISGNTCFFIFGVILFHAMVF